MERTKGPTGLEKLVLRESRGWSAEVTNSIASHPLLFRDDLGCILFRWGGAEGAKRVDFFYDGVERSGFADQIH